MVCIILPFKCHFFKTLEDKEARKCFLFVLLLLWCEEKPKFCRTKWIISAPWNKRSENMEERSTSVYVNQQIVFRMSQMTEYMESEKSPTALGKISLVLISITVQNWQTLQQGSWHINSSELKHEVSSIQTGICKSFSKRNWFLAVLVLNQARSIDCDCF